MKRYFLTFNLLLFSTLLFSQIKIGSNPLTSPDASAILELESTLQGLVLPRLTSSQRDAIVSPANGLLIFNSSSSNLEVYKSACTCWVVINDDGSTASINEAPKALNVIFPQIPAESGTLTSAYNYFDANGDLAATPIYKWYLADNSSGLNAMIIGTSSSIVLPSNSSGKFIGLGITPKAISGSLTGIEEIYYYPNPILGLATFTFTANPHTQLPFFFQTKVMDNLNSIDVEVNLSVAGSFTISTNTVNGYSFPSQTFSFNTPGIKLLTLNASGNQTSYNASGDVLTLTGIGSTTSTKSITIKNHPRGQNLSFSNGATGGNQLFSANTNCSSKPISQGYTSGTCTGNVAYNSINYSVVLINGQCWLNRNLEATPSAPCSDPINVGCNVWGNTSVGDIGSFGFLNTTSNNQWSTTYTTSVPWSANIGYLYQWSAAMAGSTHERARGACPKEWHVPSDCEIQFLEHTLGMTIAQQNTNGGRGTGDIGSKLAYIQSNSTGFTFFNGGWRNETGSFAHFNSSGYFLSSTIELNPAVWNFGLVYSRRINGTAPNIERQPYSKASAQSVRCLKD